MTSKAGRNVILFGDARRARGTPRSLDHPAPTICAGLDNENVRFWQRTDSEGHWSLAYAPSPRLSIQDAAGLQTFPRDFPWRGNRSERFSMVGNAVPPLLAEVFLRHLVTTWP
jgi:DNA (cytosine-5)-methyltransferase 1